MAIRMRRGLESELDISKAVPGEWLVSTDTRYVRMCFAPGIVLRMATYEAFEADTKKFIQQMEQILSETKTVQEAVVRIQNEIEDLVVIVENYVESAKGYSDLSNTYAMQSKQYAEEAAQQAESAEESADRAYDEAERAKVYAENASVLTDVQIATKDRAGIIKGGENYIAEDGTLQLTKQTTDTTLYNSYEGGIVVHEIGGKSEQNGIPTADAPVEINSVVLSEIKASSKNRLNCNGLIERTDNGITYTPVYNEFGSLLYVEANGTASAHSAYSLSEAYLFTEKSIFSGCPKGGNSDTGYFTAVGGVGHDYGEGLEVPPASITRWIGIGIRSGYNADHLRFYPMIRETNIADATYEPYKEITTALSKPIALNGIGDVKDRIVRKDGVWSVERNIAEIVFDESFNNFSGPTSMLGDLTCFYIKLLRSSLLGLSNRLPVGLFEADCEHIFMGSSVTTTIELRLKTERASNITELKEWLTENPIALLYESAESTFESLPDVDQTALNSLVSFDTVTYLSCGSEVEPVVDVEYGTSKVGAELLLLRNQRYVQDKTINEYNSVVGRLKRYVDDYIPSKFNWKLWNSVVADGMPSGSSIPLPEEVYGDENELPILSELLVSVDIGNKGAISNINIPLCGLSSTSKNYIISCYMNANNYGYVKFSVTNRLITMTESYLNGTNVLYNTDWEVYYR